MDIDHDVDHERDGGIILVILKTNIGPNNEWANWTNKTQCPQTISTGKGGWKNLYRI
jgi:hypothetical protein